jgi:hypothetical protein
MMSVAGAGRGTSLNDCFVLVISITSRGICTEQLSAGPMTEYFCKLDRCLCTPTGWTRAARVSRMMDFSGEVMGKFRPVQTLNKARVPMSCASRALEKKQTRTTAGGDSEPEVIA